MSKRRILRKVSRGKKKAAKKGRSQYDSPWKTIIDRHLHVEVQGDPQAEFETRMFLYASRIFDRHRLPVVSLAILGDVDQPKWKPKEFGWDHFGSRMEMEFPAVKLSEYNERWADLGSSANPIAMVVMAHLRAKATRSRHDAEERRRWKLQLVRLLLDKGLTKDEVTDLLRFIDAVMYLPPALNSQFRDDVQKLEATRTMEFISIFEQEGWDRGMEKGMEKGQRLGRVATLERQLKRRFGDLPVWALERLQKANIDQLDAWSERILDAKSLGEVFEA